MKEIKLTQGKVALVDDEDFEYLNQFKWYAIKSGNTYYTCSCRGNKNNRIRMHRLIMNTPDNLQVDHRDHNGLNNQKSNLRNCTISQNHHNKISHGRSKYLGVYISNIKHKDKIYSYYFSQINYNGKLIYLGSSKDEIKMAELYDEAAKKYHGEFANLNFK